MGLLSAAFETRASVSPSILIGDPALANYMGGGPGTSSGQNVNPDSAEKVSTVYACVHRKAATLAMLPLQVMKKLPNNGGHEVAENHRLYKQMHNNPNAWQTSYEWREMGQGHKMLRGNFYSYKQSTPGRGLNQLVPLHPDRVFPFVITPNGSMYYMYENSPPPPAGSKLYYQYFPVNGNSETFLASEILHIRSRSSNGIVGKSAV